MGPGSRCDWWETHSCHCSRPQTKTLNEAQSEDEEDGAQSRQIRRLTENT